MATVVKAKVGDLEDGVTEGGLHEAEEKGNWCDGISILHEKIINDISEWEWEGSEIE